MARTKRGVTSHARHKKIVGMAKGYVGRASTNYRIAIEKVEKGLQYAYRDRRNNKRAFRGLWIQRINAATREHGLTYSQFIAGIKAGIDRPQGPSIWRARAGGLCAIVARRKRPSKKA
jgi:large subunit ribosomal protein L20